MHPAPAVFDPYEASDSIEDLVTRARVSMQHAVDATRDYTEQQILDTILVVLDGTSPLAPQAFMIEGQKAFGSNLVDRDTMCRIVQRMDPNAAKKLAHPADCGHLQYFASTNMGGVVMCTVCDLQLKPNDKGSPNEPNTSMPD